MREIDPVSPIKETMKDAEAGKAHRRRKDPKAD